LKSSRQILFRFVEKLAAARTAGFSGGLARGVILACPDQRPATAATVAQRG